MQSNIFEPVSGVTMLSNFVDNCEQRGLQSCIVQSCFQQHCNKLLIFCCAELTDNPYGQRLATLDVLAIIMAKRARHFSSPDMV